MVSSRRNDGTITQELRYPFAGTAVQFRQESSIDLSRQNFLEQCFLVCRWWKSSRIRRIYSYRVVVFCKYKLPKVADKNGELCISILEIIAGCPMGLLADRMSGTADMLLS